ncbi:hypothetical protein F2P56_025180 [Juglans regia]|uniref:DNA 5'-3' helicase FANCJ n=1 Tax=Juglans regia TaxID=51240 RepID=A0A833UPF1_JUGRE|nr:hypothetical protein F2P56_025180 [Juglans regia]
MASATSGPNHKNVYHIGGIQVEFPYRPYGSQLAFMGRVISTLDRAQREGHCHALLESPTGTGKSLSLLCSSLAWQQNYKLKNQYGNLSQSKPAPEAVTDPLAYGGGFVPEVEPSGNPGSEIVEPAQSAAKTKNQKKPTTPTIYYASRTHSQISQVIREYRKTAYRVPMAVLASRKHYCTNKHIRGKDNIDEECKLLLSNREVGCPEFKNVHKVKGHPSLQKGGCHEAHDIEDLVKVGQVVKGCSYYAARSMADDAQLVFCPYNYIINPVIRGAMEVDIKGAIVILDEAHNIEDIARDAGSVDVEEDVLHKLQMELEQLCGVDVLTYQPLHEMTQDLINWIERRKITLEKHEFQHHVSCWTGGKALRELQEANISQQCFPILLECATKAIKAASDAESDVAHLSGMSVMTLEGLFSSLTYFFSRKGCHTFDYQLALQRYIKRDAGKAGNWTHTLSLWCLNPAVVFRDIADLSLSVVLTSGTLSPMNSFSSELGVQFGTCLEAPHVWPAIISTGPGNYPLNASYKTADAYAFQDAVGRSLEEIFKIVPGGCLVFFPSYKLMEKLCKRWCETGQWSQLNAKKSLFVEPRGGSQDDFEHVLKGYYDSIRQGNKPVLGRKRRAKKTGLNHVNAVESPDNSKEGAAFLAVFRGKVSEGIDFSDDNARVVIIVGIPFPNINDIQVALKKKYNDTHKSSKSLLSGNEWYCHQAFRALNQAAGRCIRHMFDYGAIILLADERYHEERNRAYVSKWLRNSIRQYERFEVSMEGLKSFFKDVKERIGKSTINVLQNIDNNEEKSESMIGKGQSEEFGRKESRKLNKSDHCGQKVIPVKNYDASPCGQKSHGDAEVHASLKVDEGTNFAYIDLECSFQKETRCTEALSMSFSHEDPEVSLVKETPCTTASPGSFLKDDYSSSTIIEASTEFLDQVSVPSICLSCPGKALSETQCSVVVTPDKNITMNTCSVTPEIESYLNLSVNSHTQKRRKSMASLHIDLTQDEQSDDPSAKTLVCSSFMRSSMASRDSNRRIEFGCESNCADQKLKISNVSQLLTNDDYGTPCMSSVPVMEKRLKVSCSLCKSPLGLPENDLYVMCSLTSSSKSYPASLLNENMKCSMDTPRSIQVFMTDTSSVHPELCSRTIEGAPGHGIWREEDGCVFNTIFCPSCRNPCICLGVQIVATDASNVQLLNKILLYPERLEIENLEASRDKVTKGKNFLSVSGSGMEKMAILSSIDKFSYSPQQKLEGWRTTKSKLRLPKKGLLSSAED